MRWSKTWTVYDRSSSIGLAVGIAIIAVLHMCAPAHAQSCPTGFGDCDANPENGCETNLAVAQSNSPAVYGPGAVRVGYFSVGQITHCGACGVTCNDGNPVTTDLCVPVAGFGVCRHYPRAQCGGARCSSGTEPGAPLPVEPSAAGTDAEGDGLSDAWEVPQTDPYTGTANPAPGVDLDCDGEISAADGDLIWHEPPFGSATKDIYLEYDYMVDLASGSGTACVDDLGCMTEVQQNERCVAGFCRHSHEPLPAAVSQVESAFAAQGVRLHIDPVHDQLADAPVYVPVAGVVETCPAVSLYSAAIKGGHFNPSRRLGYHYVVFAHDSCQAGVTEFSSGIAELFGNDAVVALGSLVYESPDASVNVANKTRETAGAMMHMLGHNLGLRHGGGDDVPTKPNYLSTMNQLFQFAGTYRANMPGCVPGSTLYDPPGCAYASPTPRVDFSGAELPSLTESSLDESLGIGAAGSADITMYYPGPMPAPAAGGIDWNQDGLIAGAVAADIDDSAATELGSHNDWANLRLDFQCALTLPDGGPLPESRVVSAHGSPDVCSTDFGDCDGSGATGCETPLLTDTENCGACGAECQPGRICSNGVCACPTGFEDCDGSGANGCETPLLTDTENCGACGAECRPGRICSDGICTKRGPKR